MSVATKPKPGIDATFGKLSDWIPPPCGRNSQAEKNDKVKIYDVVFAIFSIPFFEAVKVITYRLHQS